MSVTLEDLQSIAVLKKYPPSRLLPLAKVMHRVSYDPGELIFLEGDPSLGIWFILKGKVRILKQSFNGRIQSLCVTKAGKCFGGCPLFDDEKNPANAQALGEVVLLVLPHDILDNLISTDNELVWTLMHVFSERIEHLARLGEGLGAWKVSTRINDCLFAAIDSKQQMVNGTFAISLTHEQLAEQAGTVREVVTRHLACLEEQGIVRLETRQIIILEPESLRCGCLASTP